MLLEQVGDHEQRVDDGGEVEVDVLERHEVAQAAGAQVELRQGRRADGEPGQGRGRQNGAGQHSTIVLAVAPS